MIKNSQLFSFYFLIVVLFILASALNYTNNTQIDLSRNQHNSLSNKSIELLKQFKEPLQFTAYTNNEPLLRTLIQQWFNRYQKINNDMTLNWVNTETSPAIVKELNIRKNGTLFIQYQNKQQRLEKISESAISNALYKFLFDKQKKLVFLTGHGERSPIGKANYDWKILQQKLTTKGFISETRNLYKQSYIDPNTEILVLANPTSTLFEQERSLIEDFVTAGGNLLITLDPNKKQPLSFLLNNLKVSPLPGVIVDATTQKLGIDQVDFAIVSEYAAHPLTNNFKSLTLFPKAVALDINVDFDISKNTWDVYPFLSTLKHSWTETGEIIGDISYNPNTLERAGPLDIGLLLSQDKQRIIILGDSDFASNTYIGNGGNLALTFRMVQWLSGDNELLKIERPIAKDLEFELSKQFKGIVGLGFLIILPVLLLLTGLLVWNKRRRTKQ